VVLDAFNGINLLERPSWHFDCWGEVTTAKQGGYAMDLLREGRVPGVKGKSPGREARQGTKRGGIS